MAGLFMMVWTLAMLIGGVILLVLGTARILRAGPVPRRKRGDAIAYALLGMLFLAAPGLYAAATAPPQVTYGHSSSF